MILRLFDPEQRPWNLQSPVVAAPWTQDCFSRRRWSCGLVPSVTYYHWTAATSAVLVSLEHGLPHRKNDIIPGLNRRVCRRALAHDFQHRSWDRPWFHSFALMPTAHG